MSSEDVLLNDLERWFDLSIVVSIFLKFYANCRLSLRGNEFCKILAVNRG